MKRHSLAAVMLALGMIAALFPTEVRAAEPLLAVSETYRNSVYYQRLCEAPRSGDFRADLVNVALSQVGYHEGDRLEDYAGGNAIGKGNYTEYSSAFFGFNGQWCAMFVSWCARQAGIPKQLLNNASRAASDGVGGSGKYTFHIATRKSADYMPVPGDLVFFTYNGGYNSGHVGIVAEVTEKNIRTVEGNANNAVRINEYDLDSPLIFRYGVYSDAECMAKIAPIPTTKLVFASDTGEDHGIMPDDERAAYSFHSLFPMTGTMIQVPTRAFCREGYQLLGYYVRRSDDGRWLSVDQTWVAAEEVQKGNARAQLLAEGISVCWTGPWTEAAELELHCVWKDAGNAMALDESAAELRLLDREGWQNPYYDLLENYWYYADVRAASQAGLLPYVWAFEGWRGSTRGEFVVMLRRMMDRPTASPTAFVDVEADSETGAAAGWAYGAGIIKGVDATHFAPQVALSREQAVTMLFRLCGNAIEENAAETTAFADAEAVSPWAWDATVWAVKQKLLQGMPADGALYLRPQWTMTRPESVALARRIAALLDEKKVDITPEASAP